MYVYMVSLGCTKNLVDSEMILGSCEKAGIKITDNPNQADILMVNTCGFIESAKVEAINTILELVDYKNQNKKLVVMGCLAKRYKEELIKELPEVDLFISLDEYKNIATILTNLCKNKYQFPALSFLERKISTPRHLAYVKISEGCDNFCSYCAIPLIRGKFISRNKTEIIEEVTKLVLEGTKEIVLISQDTTKYGYDLSNQYAIVDLLQEITSIPDIKYVRLLYLYPDLVTDEFIEFIKKNPIVMPYFDIPVQHISTKVLKEMNRKGTKEKYYDLFKKIKKEIPHAILRTTVIIGFPNESEEDFQELIEFIREIEFDRLGAFIYSKEDDTKASEMKNQIPKSIQNARYNKIMEVQSYISLKRNMAQVESIHEVIIEGYSQEFHSYTARSYAFAPDEIDGTIYLETTKNMMIGSIVKVKITDADYYFLKAKLYE